MPINDFTTLDPRDEIVVKMRETVFAVEADTFAQQMLWNLNDKQANFIRYVDAEFDKKHRHDWVQDNSGWLPQIGFFNGGGSRKYNVSMSLTWAIIDGRRVLFYYQTSLYQDHGLSREWMFKHMPQLFPSGIDECGLLTDARNFHICVHHLANLNANKG